MESTVSTFTSITDVSSLGEFVGKTVTVRTKHHQVFKGVIHTIDPVTKRYLYNDISTGKYYTVLS